VGIPLLNQKATELPAAHYWPAGMGVPSCLALEHSVNLSLVDEDHSFEPKSMHKELE